MRASELENWVLAVASRVKAGQPVEDLRVELKAQWPADHYKAARRLAGHCNAARGETVLWIIGLDEESGVVGASQEEVGDWLASVRKHFPEVAPQVTRDLGIPIDGKTLVALLFDTERSPYVVANPAHGSPGSGPIEREVPWREGTALRTARREDLLRLLTPLQYLPDIEALTFTLKQCPTARGAQGDVERLDYELLGKLYIVPRATGRLVFPFHHCRVLVSAGSGRFASEVPTPDLYPDTRMEGGTGFAGDLYAAHRWEHKNLSRTIDSTPTELIVDGPGMVNLRAVCAMDQEALSREERLSCELSMRPAGSDRSVQVAAFLGRVRQPSESAHQTTWAMRPPQHP